VVIAKELNAKANLSYSETAMKANRLVINKLGSLLWPGEPIPEKPLKDYVPEHYHRYLDIFTKKEAIPLLPHRPETMSSNSSPMPHPYSPAKYTLFYV
jgi:hypothetical protein